MELHSYRYAWAERAKKADYLERFAQEALGLARAESHPLAPMWAINSLIARIHAHQDLAGNAIGRPGRSCPFCCFCSASIPRWRPRLC